MLNKLIITNFHLVNNSPLPIFAAFNIYYILIGLVGMIYNVKNAYYITIIGIISILYNLLLWFKDIIIESTYEGGHTKRVQKGIMLGLILFIVSEICLFGTLFFSYFYNSLIPSIESASIIPPIGIIAIDPKALPLLNTFILFLSGITSTLSLNLFISNKKIQSILFLTLTIILGITFSVLQYVEYITATFTITDSVYGSNIYLLSGFHGVHVIVGILFLISANIRILLNQMTNEHYILLTFANIYWHFVDYVWLILYVFLYCWGS